MQMDSHTIKDILGIQFSSNSDSTVYTDYTNDEKRQMVTAAILELYRAEALGGGSSAKSINTNLNSLSGHIDLVISALESQE
jgi:hypothetical protein